MFKYKKLSINTCYIRKKEYLCTINGVTPLVLEVLQLK